MPPSSTLIVDRGDLPSLAACSIQGEPGSLLLLHLVESDEAAGRRRAAIENHGTAWGIDRLVIAQAPELGVPGMAPPAELYEATVLVQAITVARQLGCPRIVWPLVIGHDREAIDAALARADAVSGLCGSGLRADGPSVELPLVDLSDRQIVELAGDTGAPGDGFWPCNDGGAVPCRRCEGCRRWLAAFSLAGRPWPWRPPVAAAA